MAYVLLPDGGFYNVGTKPKILALGMGVLDSTSIDVAATRFELEITAHAASVVVGVGVSASAAALEVTAHGAVITAAVNVAADFASLELSAYQAEVCRS